MGNYKGKNVDEAIENGLYELNLKKSEVKINIIDHGNAGIFGFFEKEAEVEITPLSPMELKIKKLIPYLIGAGVIFMILLLVLIVVISDKSTTVSTPSSTETSSVIEKSVEKTSESSSTSSSSTPASSSSTNTTSSSTETSSTSPSQATIITVENNEDFKSLLQTEDQSVITDFIQKHKGQIIEFDGNIANLAKSKSKYDILIHSGIIILMRYQALISKSLKSLSSQILYSIHLMGTILKPDKIYILKQKSVTITLLKI